MNTLLYFLRWQLNCRDKQRIMYILSKLLSHCFFSCYQGKVAVQDLLVYLIFGWRKYIFFSFHSYRIRMKRNKCSSYLIMSYISYFIIRNEVNVGFFFCYKLKVNIWGPSWAAVGKRWASAAWIFHFLFCFLVEQFVAFLLL